VQTPELLELETQEAAAAVALRLQAVQAALEAPA
jgi:hypothetical protein